MADLYYQKFVWADYLNSSRVKLMTLIEQGAYVRALGHCFLDGRIPADPKKLALLIGSGCTKKTASAILDMFDDIGDAGYLTHSRTLFDRNEAMGLSKVNSANAKAAAEKRRLKKETDALANAERTPSEKVSERDTNIIVIATDIVTTTEVVVEPSPSPKHQIYEKPPLTAAQIAVHESFARRLNTEKEQAERRHSVCVAYGWTSIPDEILKRFNNWLIADTKQHLMIDRYTSHLVSWLRSGDNANQKIQNNDKHTTGAADSPKAQQLLRDGAKPIELD